MLEHLNNNGGASFDVVECCLPRLPQRVSWQMPCGSLRLDGAYYRDGVKRMTEEEATTLGNVVLSEVVDKLSIPSIRIAAAAAGIDASRIPAKSEEKGGSGSRAEVAPALLRLYAELPLDRKIRALGILAERVGAGADDALTKLLTRHGYELRNGAFLPIGLVDEREALYLPPNATTELSKALSRLAGSDESGAITAACGAVDGTTTALFERHRLGNASASSFQAKINTALNRLGVFGKIERDLISIGIRPEDAQRIATETHEATKHASEALQVIRRALGDVHGTKPAYKKIAYETIKWASAICGLLEGE
jgi:hypothetical protein